MTPEQALKQEAQWYAAALASMRGGELDPNTLNMRAVTYNPTWQRGRNRVFVCPKCWISSQQRLALRAVPGDMEYDVLRCGSQREPGCDSEFIVPFA